MRSAPFDFGALCDLVHRNAKELSAGVQQVFRQGWPEADASVTDPARLRAHVEAIADSLEAVVRRLYRRLRWAMDQIRRLNTRRELQGTLDPEDDSLFRRCDKLMKRLKGVSRRSKSQAEGHDDFNTFSVLSAEGFLPGYGLEIGSVVGWAEIPFWRTGAMDFSLPRPPATALREYVPGNLIYANGHRFVARREQIRLHRPLGTTTPDVIYRIDDHEPDEGVCIYLDGLSAHIHGNPETVERDREIRTWLRNRGYEVIEIAANHLDDEDAMVRHFRRLASYLGMPDVRIRVREDRSWFREPGRGKSLLQVLTAMTPLASGEEFPDVDDTLAPLDEEPFGPDR